MSEIDSIGATAFHIAGLRAREERRPVPLFSDPYARLFHHDEINTALDAFERGMPVFPAVIRVRTRWFDDELVRALDEGSTQVLTLGAGFDCRALRLARPGVRWFEVDRAPVLSYKQKQLTDAGHGEAASAIVPVAADYSAPDFVDRLVAAGLDPSRRTFVIWEGNTYYLTVPIIRDVLGQLGGALRDAFVALDYMTPAVLRGESRSPGMRKAIPVLRGMNATWTGAIDDATALAASLGYRVIEDNWFAALKQRFQPRWDVGEDIHVENGFCLLRRIAR